MLFKSQAPHHKDITGGLAAAPKALANLEPLQSSGACLGILTAWNPNPSPLYPSHFAPVTI